MKKTTKTALIVSAILIVSGIVILISALLSVSFDFSKLDYTSYNTEEYKCNVYDVDYDFSDVYINDNSLDIYFTTTTESKAYVQIIAQEGIRHQVYVENGKLIVKRTSDSYKNTIFSINLNNTNPAITVYLPEKEYNELTIESSSGDVCIYEDKFSFKNSNITSSSGEINVFGCVTNSLKIGSSSGDIEVGYYSPKSVNVSTNSGRVYLQKLTKTEDISINTTSGDIGIALTTCDRLTAKSNSGAQEFSDVIITDKAKIESTSGDICLEIFDSGELELSSLSGDIYGELLSKKKFVTDTASGDVDIAHDAHGENGECNINTASGDITIRLSK